MKHSATAYILEIYDALADSQSAGQPCAAGLAA